MNIYNIIIFCAIFLQITNYVNCEKYYYLIKEDKIIYKNILKNRSKICTKKICLYFFNQKNKGQA